MPIAKPATTPQTKTDDAPRASSVSGEAEAVVAAVAREPVVAEAGALDASLEDPYDNVACTD